MSSIVHDDDVDEGDFLGEVQLTSKYFHGFGRDELKTLAKSFSIMDISRGDVIVQQGETGSWAGLLMSGELHISIDGQRIPGVIHAGQCVGEMAVFANGRRAATITCAVEGQIATMLIRDLQRLLREKPAIGAKLVTAFARSVMETLIVYKVPRWKPSSVGDLAPAVGCRAQLDEWLEHLRTDETGFTAEQSGALGCFQVFSFEEGASIVELGAGVFQGLAVVLDGSVECSWPSGARTVDKFGLIGEHSLFLDDWSLQMPRIKATSAGSLAVLSEAAFAHLREEHPLFHAALVYLMAAETVHQLSTIGQLRDPGLARLARRKTITPAHLTEDARYGGAMEILYKVKMVAGLKLEAAAAGELAKDSAAKLERTAFALRRYKVLALKFERERDGLITQVNSMESDMKLVRNQKRELSNARAECQALRNELDAARALVEQSSSEYMRERYEQQVAEAKAWKKTALSEHAARERQRESLDEQRAGAAAARTRAAELEAQVGALARERDEQAAAAAARDVVRRELEQQNAALEAHARKMSERYCKLQLRLEQSGSALRSCKQERCELAERLRLASERRHSTVVRKAAELREGQAHGALATIGGSEQPADDARDIALAELSRINNELAEKLQEQSAALWAANRRLAQAGGQAGKSSAASGGDGLPAAQTREDRELKELTERAAARMKQASLYFGRLADQGGKPAPEAAKAGRRSAWAERASVRITAEMTSSPRRRAGGQTAALASMLQRRGACSLAGMMDPAWPACSKGAAECGADCASESEASPRKLKPLGADLGPPREPWQRAFGARPKTTSVTKPRSASAYRFGALNVIDDSLMIATRAEPITSAGA